MHKRVRIAVWFGIALLAPVLRATSISVYLSAPSAQATFVGAATTETFDTATAGTYQTYASVIGTYGITGQDSFVIQGADQFGGASGSQYMTFGAQSGNANPIDLALTTPADYFGFWWSAGDANNGLTFYSGTTAIGRFSTATILSLLQPTTVTAVDGTVYQSSQYFGNPNNSAQDTGEHFAYVNFLVNGGTVTNIVFDNSSSTGTGFESDNHSVYNGAVTVAPSAVFVSTIATPEPASWALCLGGAGILAGLFCRRRMQKRL
jgi:hypothetical protein